MLKARFRSNSDSAIASVGSIAWQGAKLHGARAKFFTIRANQQAPDARYEQAGIKLAEPMQ
jgi:hypothetical protein